MARPNIIQSKPRLIAGNVLVAVLLALSLASVFLYEKEGESGPLHSIQGAAGMVLAPVQYLGAGVAYAEDTAGEAVQNATVSNESYTALRDENAKLKAQLVEMEEYRTEAQRLQGLLDLTDRYQLGGVTGRVIGKSADAWNRVITVGAGSNAGVELGAPVVGSSGVVGQVVEVAPLTCKVRLLSDARSGVSVMLQSNRATGVVTGSIEGLLYLESIDSSVEVNVGDVVITSGLGGAYFGGLALGTVVNVISAAGTSDRTIVVSAFSDADALEEVSIVTSMGNAGELAGMAQDTLDSQDGSYDEEGGE